MIASPTAAECTKLATRALSVKKRFLAMYKKANAGHVGSSLSCAELLVFCHFAWLREHDKLVLSKGHAAAALYALLAEAKRLDPAQLASFYRDGTQLSALPPFNALDDIPFATGSLGHGLSLSAGMALGARLEGRDQRIFCVTSDGELDEGSVWEAALFIAHRKLSNVVWLIDRNNIQGFGRTEDVIALEPLGAKLHAFGYHVLTVDGHDFASLLAGRAECERVLETRNVPLAVIANTIKGNGVPSMHDTIDSHYLPLSDAQYEQALSELDRAHEAKLSGYRDAR